MERQFSLAEAVHRHGQTQAGALALSSDHGDLSYRELARSAAGLAALLQETPGWSTRGAEPPRVAILASRSIEACIAVLGANWAGASFVPLGHKLPEERILTILSLCGVSALVTDEQGARLLTPKVLEAAPPAVFVLGGEARGAGGPRWLAREALAALPGPEPSPFAASDTAYIIFTSGSTGVPKGVMVSAGAISHYVETMTAMMGLRPADRVLETFELTFDASLHSMFTAWQAGASLHVLAAARAMNAVRFAREHQVTALTITPCMVGMLRQLKALGPGCLPGVRVAAFGGEQLSRTVIEAWHAAAPQSAIFNLYGPTEATVCCLGQRVEHPIPLLPERDSVAIGEPLPGSEAAVLDRSGCPVPDGTPGELAIAGVQLAKGYLNAPELTAARFPTYQGKRWYLTGDLAVRDASGRFHCLGRIDNQIKVLGHRVELEEVDAHLRIVADTGLAASVGWPLKNGAAQGIVSFVAGTSLGGDEILDGLRVRLPPYMVPSRVLPVQTMPINGSGKVDRKALQQLLEQG
jgi:D-alanine--poly(phosphoribitol) ligase subunit 1